MEDEVRKGQQGTNYGYFPIFRARRRDERRNGISCPAVSRCCCNQRVLVAVFGQGIDAVVHFCQLLFMFVFYPLGRSLAKRSHAPKHHLQC